MEEVESPTEHDQRETKPGPGMPILLLSVTSILVLTSIFLDALGNRVSSELKAAGEQFVEQPVYAAAVLTGRPTGPVRLPESEWHLEAFLKGLAGAIGAFIVACLSLPAGHFKKSQYGKIWSTFDAIRGVLNKAHYGHIGDLIVWLVIGIVVIGAVLTLG